MRDKDLQFKILEKQIEFEKLGPQTYTVPTTSTDGIGILGGTFKKYLNSEILVEQLKNYSLIEINKNIELLNDNGCLKISKNSRRISIKRILDKGYDFLENKTKIEGFSIQEKKELIEAIKNLKKSIDEKMNLTENELYKVNNKLDNIIGKLDELNKTDWKDLAKGAFSTIAWDIMLDETKRNAFFTLLKVAFSFFPKLIVG